MVKRKSTTIHCPQICYVTVIIVSMLDYIGVQYIVFGNFKNDNSYYVGDFNIKIADSHPDTGISEEHFVLEVIPMNSMKLSING